MIFERFFQLFHGHVRVMFVCIVYCVINSFCAVLKLKKEDKKDSVHILIY